MAEDLKVKAPDNLDIDQALKEFEVKSGAEEMQRASEISKNLDDTPKMVKLVMKLSGGAIKTQKQAEAVLLLLVLAIVAFSLFLVFG